MTISLHPSGELRQAYAAGELSPGVVLALESHFGLCPVCALAAESIGAGRRRRPKEAEPGARRPTGPDVAPSLAARVSGRWRRLSRKVRIAPLAGVSGLGEAVHLVRAAPGAGLERLARPEVEIVLPLKGGARAREAGYLPGDLLEAPRTALADAIADPVEGLLALVVSLDSWPRRRLPGLLDPLRLAGGFGKRRAG